MSRRLKKGDRVVVIAGNDRGKVGKIMHSVGNRVIIEGANLKTRHLKPTEEAPRGRIVQAEAPIHRSNVQLCPSGEKGVRLRTRIDKEGERELYYQARDKDVIHRKVKQ